MSTAHSTSVHPYKQCPQLVLSAYANLKRSCLLPSLLPIVQLPQMKDNVPHDLLRTCRAGQPVQHKHVLHLPGHTYRTAQVLIVHCPSIGLVFCTDCSGLDCQQRQPAALGRACEDTQPGRALGSADALSVHVLSCHAVPQVRACKHLCKNGPGH